MSDTKTDVNQHFHTFLRTPAIWTPRSINAMIDSCQAVGIGFWDESLDKIGQFGVQQLAEVMRVAQG